MIDMEKHEVDDKLLEDVTGGSDIYSGMRKPTLLEKWEWPCIQPCKMKPKGGFHEPCFKDDKWVCSLCGETLSK